MPEEVILLSSDFEFHHGFLCTKFIAHTHTHSEIERERESMRETHIDSPGGKAFCH